MLITGEDPKNREPGTALLLAAAPAGKGRLMDAASVLPALAAVPADILAGTAGAASATVIELADPLDPQAVLTRIRAAAAAPGPLHLYLAGQLQVDRKQRRLHMALARTAPATLRYTGLPWHWLAGEIKARRPGTTTVVLDLVADAEAWEQVTDGHIGLGDGTRVYGRIAPTPGRRQLASPVHLKAVAGIWRSGARPPLPELHEQAAAQAAAENGPDGALLFGLAGPGPAGAAHAAGSGAWADTPGPGPAPVRPATGAEPPQRGPVPAPGPGAVPSADVRPAPRPESGDEPPQPGAEPAPPGPGPAASPRPGAVPPREPGTEAPAVERPDGDPHPAILAAAMAGRHAEAAAAASAREDEALRAHGPGSVQVLHWLEVRADLARLARDPARSCELWMAAAEVRLGRQQTPDDPDVEAAVDRAHHQWEQTGDTGRARRLAPALVALRRRVPGRQRGALRLLQRRLEQLHEHRPATPTR
ncbi:hypothetical protein [Streptomyces sp. NPDC006274]|uniref:hypothetical protein n=1 Tax=unclassified Streptomyces TaxID=2593676 RepID=UPI0033A6DF2E